MTQLVGELKEKLRELFQFESEDLDFGIYRIMNYKRKEIEKFIEKELIDEIKKQLQLLSEEERKKIEERLNEISSKNGVKKYLEALEKRDEERARIYREDFKEQIEEYERLKRQLEEIKISEDLEREIYNHLINFFSRYYDKGDFISKRRYGKSEKYMVPYNGEEVLLYWANKDQYYIKTTEYFHKYTFKIKGNYTVNFRVISAEEEKGNVKANDKKFFVLAKDKVYDFDKKNKVIDIYFEYRALTYEEKEKYKKGNSVSQDIINEETIAILQKEIPENSLARVIFEEEGEKTLIEKHLYRYTRRNSTDYFIHKDLKGFLERELDFYIKNEFLDLDDLQVLEESGYFDKLRLYLIGVRAFRNIALKIIEFLAQIENFQKKLWEKKKFVIDTHYVITLDKIKEYAGEEFLESIIDDILNNEKQLEEWKELFEIEVKRKEDLITNNGKLQFNGKDWKKLPIDTKYFDEEFKWKLLVALTKNNYLDEILDGVLVKSENWQALNLLLNKYYEKVQTIYIDPPYNTGSDEFLYKDNYQHSSWLTMMENRLRLAKKLMRDSGVIFTNIGDLIPQNGESYRLQMLQSVIFPIRFGNLIWKKRGGIGSFSEKNMTENHEYITVFGREKSLLYHNIVSKSKLREYNKYKDSRGPYRWMGLIGPSQQTKEKRPNLNYGILYDEINDKIIGFEYFVSNKKERYFFDNKHSGKVIAIWLPGKSTWLISKEVVEKYYKQGLIKVFKKKKGYEVKIKNYLYKEDGSINGDILKSILTDNGIPIGMNIEATREITAMFPELENMIRVMNPKPVSLITLLIYVSTKKSDLILDFFAGSGTSAHAVMKLNKEDGGKRKFILVEMADYFDTVIIPRIKKVAYSFNWKEGKPQDTDGIGVFFKYHTLEQYEDALENIEFEEQDEKQRKIVYELPDYFVKYMLDWETKNSNTFLNLKQLQNPFEYKLKIIENYEQKTVFVDVVETFNYLLGLDVHRYKVVEDNDRKYVFVFGKRGDEKVAIVWRNVIDMFYRDISKVVEELEKAGNRNLRGKEDMISKLMANIERIIIDELIRREAGLLNKKEDVCCKIKEYYEKHYKKEIDLSEKGLELIIAMCRKSASKIVSDKKIIEENLKEFEPDEIYINGEAVVKGFRHIEPLFRSLMFDKAK